eukprot:364541-Chlamydomonas_euryale.AAC.6
MRKILRAGVRGRAGASALACVARTHASVVEGAMPGGRGRVDIRPSGGRPPRNAGVRLARWHHRRAAWRRLPQGGEKRAAKGDGEDAAERPPDAGCRPTRYNAGREDRNMLPGSCARTMPCGRPCMPCCVHMGLLGSVRGW